MTTENERIVRWKLIAAVVVVAIAAGLVVLDKLTGGQFVTIVGGLFG